MANSLKENFGEDCYMSCGMLLSRSSIILQFVTNYASLMFESLIRYPLIILIGFGPIFLLSFNTKLTFPVIAIFKLPCSTKNLGPSFANSIDGVFDLFDKIIFSASLTRFFRNSKTDFLKKTAIKINQELCKEISNDLTILSKKKKIFCFS